MGASTFITAARGGDVSEAFNTGCREAAHESGHGGYTGTLAEKHTFVVISAQPMLEHDATALAHKMIRERDPRIEDKWGPAGAIAFGDAAVLSTRTATVTLTGLGDTMLTSQITAALEAKAKRDERLGRFHTVSDESVWTTTVARSSEPAVKRYYLSDGYGHRVGSGTYPSVAAARAALTTFLRERAGAAHPMMSEGEYGIRGEIVTEAGGPLVVGRIARKKRTTVVQATYHRYAPVTAVTGWVLFGWASD
jgi:hypothetical protein